MIGNNVGFEMRTLLGGMVTDLMCHADFPDMLLVKVRVLPGNELNRRRWSDLVAVILVGTRRFRHIIIWLERRRALGQ